MKTAFRLPFLYFLHAPICARFYHGNNENRMNTDHSILMRPFGVVRETGLEPVRHKHTPLKRACLPIPALALNNMYYSTQSPICQLFISQTAKNILNSLFCLQLLWKKLRKYAILHIS